MNNTNQTKNNNSSNENDLETALETPNHKPLIALKENGAILNNKSLQWNFMIKTTSLLVLLHTMMITLTYIYAINSDLFLGILRNYTNIGDGYDIFAICLLGVTLIFSTVLPRIARVV